MAFKLPTYLCARGDVQLAHTATRATEVEESPQAGGRAGGTGSPPAVRMDEKETRLTESFAQQPSISAGCRPVFCCLLGHDVFFSCGLLF